MDMVHGLNIYSVLLRLMLSALLSGIIGLEREQRGQIAGFRTHIIVCLGAALSTMIGVYCNVVLKMNTDALRIASQVVSGIGFIGAGTILVKSRSKVIGLTTAAGLWLSAVIGLAIGAGFYAGAFICFAMSFVTLKLFVKLEKSKLLEGPDCRLYIEIDDSYKANYVIDFLRELNNNFRDFEVFSARSALPNHIGIITKMTLGKNEDIEKVMKKIVEHENVVFVIKSY
ncbi:MAG: MgtC/SapB family protein [Clostridia bacterium]|nr:MgtC/SapB family protein [Clostridia bacterium]MCI2014823.1 MgtC/SapB family protein [Clostridia bacterium]